jgi:long-chain fatty acid transport protein
MKEFYLRIMWISCSLFLFTVLAATSAWSAGLWLYEYGAPDMGTAAAGRAALAKDASTAGGNPAGMTRLERSELLLGTQPMIYSAKFEADSRTTVSGGNGGDAGGFIGALGLFYVHSLTKDLKLGVATGTYFGLGLDYDDSWAGRYYVQEAELITFGVNPSIAYRVNNWLSVGGGFSVVYAELSQKAAINNEGAGDAGFPDGKIGLEDDDIGFGGNAGVLIEAAKGTRFGFSYRSEVELEFKDLAKIEGLGPTLTSALTTTGLLGSQADFTITIPQAVMVSAYHELTDKFAIMGNVGWQDWSEFGKTEVTIRSTNARNFTSDRKFDDTIHAAIGIQYRLSKPWLLSAGFAYDSSPVDNEDRTVDMPLDRQLRYATGLQYEWSKDITLGFAYEFLDAGDADINQTRGPLTGTIAGNYETNQIHLFNINLIWRF